MPRCKFCNQESPLGVRQCPHCGASASEPADVHTLETEIRMLLTQGRKIEAIKLHREHTGAGLKEAKAAVEAVERGQTLAGPPPLDSDLEDKLLSLLERGQKVQAIKLYQERTGLGLKTARNSVDALAARHGLARPGAGCLGMIALSLSLGSAAIVLWR